MLIFASEMTGKPKTTKTISMQLYMKKGTIILSALLALGACSESPLPLEGQGEALPIELSGQIVQENVTRADDRGFVTGDRMGIYIVDRDGEATLGATDNRASNVLFTYDGDGYRWTSPTQIYWRDQETAIDVYGYYPGVNYISDPTAYEFSVETDQSTEAANGDLSGYEQSDLLWGKTTSRPTTDQIVVKYGHILAGVRVQLQKGTGISDTEWEKLEKIVLVDNTVTTATVNLATGTVLPTPLRGGDGGGVTPIRMVPQADGHYRAIVIPQTVAAQKQLLSITLDGQTYSHKLDKAMQYEAGKLHNFTMTVNRSELTGDYEVKVTDGGITPWENDQSSHQFTANAYIVVNCSEPGKLEENIRQAGYDPQAVQNLKVTGKMTTEDFQLLRNGMPELRHLNLKKVSIKQAKVGRDWDSFKDILEDYAIPEDALLDNKSIRSLVLPDTLTRIGAHAFARMQLMYSTLEVPEGVKRIDGGWPGAFGENDYNGVELILPYSLEYIGDYVFMNCCYSCELHLTDNITYLGGAVFDASNGPGTPNFHGVFHLPSQLLTYSTRLFASLGSNGSFTGEIEIPQGVTEIPQDAFRGIAFKNRIPLTLPAGVKKIGGAAFAGIRLTSLELNNDLRDIDGSAFIGASMPFPITLPASLRSIGINSFSDCGIEGELVIPEQCLSIGNGAFSRNNFTKITLPSKLEAIGSGTFAGNPYLTSITIPKYVETIGWNAFGADEALQTVICKNPEPPILEDGAFSWVHLDKCVLEVPEASVEAYRHADGWKEFQNITAYHELAFNVSEILCLDKGQTVKGIIRAEGAWEVSECPDWVTVSPMSGTADERKAELTVTVKPLGVGDPDREGRIVFRLKDKDYTTYTTVRQHNLVDAREDQKVVLQTASAGAARAIPIFIVGEGYDADDIANGHYIEEMKEQMEYLFSCEPYKTYRNYFTVSTAIAVSPEHGINGRTRFQPENPWEGRDEPVWQYAKTYGEGITDERAGQTTVIVLYNSNYLGDNYTSLRDDGRAICYLGKSTDSYPYEQREYVLREVGGVAFGKLGAEGISHFTFIKACTCPNCNKFSEYQRGKSLGWYDNISLSGKMNEVPWSHLIFDERFAQTVDIFEGAYNHARGIYRSENMSIMGNLPIPYFNAISRQSIVKRILEYSGEGYTFEKFVAKDKREYPEE